MPITKYPQRIIDEVYRRGCVKREAIVELLMREFGLPKGKADKVASVVLSRLADRGIVVSKGRGYWAKP